jgi:hypothetical protein|tara:strand:+ start:153 stop:254 length:102 start_codon:yes stop_codon:yes gene_type:complete
MAVTKFRGIKKAPQMQGFKVYLGSAMRDLIFYP